MRCVTSRVVLRALEQIVPKTHDEKKQNKTTAQKLVDTSSLTNLPVGHHGLCLTVRAGCHAERVATAREEVLPSLPPATLA